MAVQLCYNRGCGQQYDIRYDDLIQNKPFGDGEPDLSWPKLALLMLGILQYLSLTKFCPADSENI